MSLVFTPEQKAEIRRLCRVETQPVPTLLLFVAGLALCLAAFYSGWFGHTLLAFYLALPGQYLLYTCMHEAVHRVASPYRFVNWLIGVISSSAFFSPFTGFRYVHLKHHRLVNHPTKDPDIWSAKRFLLFRWFTQDYYYYYVYLKDGGYRLPSFWRAALQVTVNLLLLGWMVQKRGWAWPLCAWLLPARFVIAWLSFVFNYLPHYPHDPVVQDSAVKDTCARTFPGLGLLLLGQNLHNVHHLWPAAPFYRYAAIWRVVGDELVRAGAPVKKRLFEL